MDNTYRSSSDAGLSWINTTEGRVLNLAIVNPLDCGLAHDIAEVIVPPGASAEALALAVSGLLPPGAIVNQLVVATTLGPDGSSIEDPIVLDQALEHSELQTKGRRCALQEVVCFLPDIRMDASTTKVLIIQLGETSSSIMVEFAGVERSERSAINWSELTLHKTGLGQVQALVSPFKDNFDQIVILPTDKTSAVAEFSASVRAEYPNIPCLCPTREALANAAAIHAAVYAKRLFSNHTFNWFASVPIGIVTSAGTIVNVSPTGMEAVRVLHSRLFETEEDGQRTVSVRVIVGAIGDTISGHENISRVVDTIRLEDLVQPVEGPVRVRVTVLVKKSYDVAISVEQIGVEGGHTVVRHYPAMMLRVKQLVKDVYKAAYGDGAIWVDSGVDEVVGKLPA